MRKDDIIIKNKNGIDESDNKIDSFLDEITDVVVNKSDSLKIKIDDTISNINRLKEDLCNLKLNEDANYNYFSPLYVGDSINKGNLKSQISLFELQLNEFVEDYQNTNKQINHIAVVKKYIRDIENMLTELQNSDHKELEHKDNKLEEVKDNYKYDEVGLKLLKTQELERKRIARDLHDSTVQNLTSLIHKTELCSKYVDIDNIRTKLELETMKKTIRNTIHDMREIIYDLRPMTLDDLGFITTVERYIDILMKSSGVIITFEVENEKNDMYPIISSTLFRIIQEACNNVVKHAMANNIDIVLSFYDYEIILIIEDDGVGFEAEKYLENANKSNSNFGLSIMLERVYMLSGQIHIDSRKNQGTKIYIKVPMSSCMEENE